MTDKLFDYFEKEEREPDPVGSPDWEKASLGVIVTNGVYGCVLFHVGAHLCDMIENGSSNLDDLGLDDAPVGITVWEGKIHGSFHDTVDGREYESELVGAFRAPTDVEWAAIREGKCPWDENDWLVKAPAPVADRAGEVCGHLHFDKRFVMFVPCSLAFGHDGPCTHVAVDRYAEGDDG